MTQILPKVKELVATGQCTPETRPRFTKLKASLEEQLTSLRQLDEEILNGLMSVEGVTDEEIAEKVRTAGDLKGQISATIIKSTYRTLMLVKFHKLVQPLLRLPKLRILGLL